MPSHRARSEKTVHSGMMVVAEEVKTIGVEVLAQYALLGGNDFCNDSEAPDDHLFRRGQVQSNPR